MYIKYFKEPCLIVQSNLIRTKKDWTVMLIIAYYQFGKEKKLFLDQDWIKEMFWVYVDKDFKDFEEAQKVFKLLKWKEIQVWTAFWWIYMNGSVENWENIVINLEKEIEERNDTV